MTRPWIGGFCVIAALTLVGRMFREPREDPVPPRSAGAATPTRAPAESRRAPAADPGEADRRAAAALVGYWRGETVDGVTTSFRFDASGDFGCIVDLAADGGAPVTQGGAAGAWRVERGRLHVRWVTTDTPSFQAVIGRTAQSAIRFVGGDWVRLAGIEGDDVERLYRRAY